MTERLLYESMIRVETDHYVCRIWRERKELTTELAEVSGENGDFLDTDHA